MDSGSKEGTGTKTGSAARVGSKDNGKGQTPSDKNITSSLAGREASQRTPGPHDTSLNSGTAPDEGTPGTAVSGGTILSTGSNNSDTGGTGLKSVTEFDKNGNQGSNANSGTGTTRTNGEKNVNRKGSGGGARGTTKGLDRKQQENGRGTGLSTSGDTPTPVPEQVLESAKGTVGPVAVSTDEILPHGKNFNGAGMGTVSSGGKQGRRAASNVSRNGPARDNSTSEGGAGDIEANRRSEVNGEAHSTRGKQGSIDQRTDVPGEYDGNTTTPTEDESRRAGGKQATSVLRGADPKSVWSNKAPTPILIGGVPPSELNTKRCDRERLSATPEPRRSANMKKKSGKAPANGSMPPPPLPARFSSPLTPTSALGTTPGSRSGSTPRPTTPTEWEPTPVSSPEVSLAGAISRAGKANTITYQKAKSTTSMPAKPVGPARKGQPATKTAKTNDPNLARLQSARRREPTPTRDQVTHEGEPPILPLNNKHAPLTTFEEQERRDQARTRFRKNAERHAKNHLEIIEDAVPNEKSDEIAKKRTRQERKVAIRKKKNEEYLKELKEVNNIPNKFYIASEAFAKMAMFCMERRRCNQAGKRIMPGQTIMRRVYPSYYLQVGYTHLSCITPGAAKRLLTKNGSIQRVLFSEAFEKHADKVKVLNSLQTKAQRAPSSARVVRARARKVLGMKPLLNHSLMYRAKIVDRVMNACKEAQKVIRTKLLEIDSEMAQEKYEENMEKAMEPLDRLITYGDIVLDDGVPSECQDIDMEADESHFDYSLLRGVNTWIYSK
ncbi:hypothetical protein K474DRAFT_1777146 [Panus rudis PR-1116 ss-1]|nr:hypothetical protein K474DRAFT_1777146 [Panus rudis PR-1116 ss-1]